MISEPDPWGPEGDTLPQPKLKLDSDPRGVPRREDQSGPQAASSSQLVAQEHVVPSSQRTSKRRRTTTPADRRTPGKDEWDPRLLREFNEYLQSPQQARQTMWRRWTSNEKRLVYLFSNKASKEEQNVWKTEALEEESLQSSCWQHDLTQDGDVEANPGPWHQSVNKQGGNATRGGGGAREGTRRRRRERRQPWPRPSAQQARASRATPKNRAKNLRTYTTKAGADATRVLTAGKTL